MQFYKKTSQRNDRVPNKESRVVLRMRSLTPWPLMAGIFILFQPVDSQIFRIRFSVCRSDGVKANTASRVGGVVAAIVAVLLAVMSALGCDLGNIEGVGDTYTQPSCSTHCG